MTHTKTPWKLEVGKYSGNNWMVGSIYFGRSRENDKEYWAHITTDGVHASEMGCSDAKTDAELWVTACNSHDALFEAAKAALKELEYINKHGLGDLDTHEVEAQLRAAIAQAEPDKAEGGEG